MKTHRRAVLMLGLCASAFLITGRARSNDVAKSKDEESGVTITLGSLRMTNRAVEMRCEVWNGTEQDIWVYDDLPGRQSDVPETNAKIYLDKEWRTFLILRRINLPLHGISTSPIDGVYTRLRAGQSRPYVFLVILPVRVEMDGLQGFEGAIRAGRDRLTRLAFQIGYYTSEDLRALKPKVRSWFASIDFESPDRVRVEEDPRSSITSSERAATVAMDGVSIPYKQWIIRMEIDPLKRAQQLSEKPAPLTALERLRDLFYNFSLDFEQYQYGQKLLQIDPRMYNEAAKRIAGLYTQVAQGTLRPAELRGSLDKILSEADREKLLASLQEEQSASPPKK